MERKFSKFSLEAMGGRDKSVQQQWEAGRGRWLFNLLINKSLFLSLSLFLLLNDLIINKSPLVHVTSVQNIAGLVD